MSTHNDLVEHPARDGPLRARWTRLADRCRGVDSEAGASRGAETTGEIDGALGSLLPLLLEHEPGESGALRLLFAWPRAWNASFRVHPGRGTVVDGQVRDGRLESLEVHPPDVPVELGPGWSRPERRGRPRAAFRASAGTVRVPTAKIPLTILHPPRTLCRT